MNYSLYKKPTLVLGMILMLISTSCDEDSFLTQDNPNAITTNTFWQSSDDFDKGLNTVYGALQFSSVSGAFLAYDMVKSDLGGTEFWYPHSAFSDLAFTDATEHVQNKWNELYVGIFRANQVIENVVKEGTSLSSEEALSVEAQARFLRAFF
jgi:hypothetical protein